MLLRESLEESIKELVKFEFGSPSADTIFRVFRNVNADKIEKVFIKWAHGIYEKVKIESDRSGKHDSYATSCVKYLTPSRKTGE